MSLSWRELEQVNIFGASSIAHVVGVYEVLTKGHVGRLFSIKVVQDAENRFVAYPNVAVKSASGEPRWTCGSGETEFAALSRAVETTMKALSERQISDDDLEWMNVERV